MNSRISSLQNADDILILEWIKVEEKIAEKRIGGNWMKVEISAEESSIVIMA